MKKDPLERLLSRIDRRSDDECWPFKGALDTHGYGQFKLEGKQVRAHRAVVLLIKKEPLGNDLTQKGPQRKGAIGSRREVRHLCYNRICCNPAHIVYGNHSENMKDVVAAGNFKPPKQKLKPADYVAICASKEPSSVLAKRFNITATHVRDIRYDRSPAARKYVTVRVSPWPIA